MFFARTRGCAGGRIREDRLRVRAYAADRVKVGGSERSSIFEAHLVASKVGERRFRFALSVSWTVFLSFLSYFPLAICAPLPRAV